jgi:signal transduction histidine kinase
MAAIEHQQESSKPGSGWFRALAAWFDHGDPHPFRGPFTRWPRTTDGLLALAVFAGAVIAVTASTIDDGQEFTLAAIRDRPAAAFALLALAAAALWWRRAHPIAVAAVVLALMISWALAGFGDGQDLAVAVASYSVGRYADNNRNSVATVAAIVAVSIIGTIVDANQRIDVAPAVVFAVLPWYVGRRIRERGDYLILLQERAERLETEHAARARQAVADERSRIARELHDVVAHQVSMMTVQSGAAKTVARHDLDAAIRAMGDVERAGRKALGELRHLLGVLRADTTDPDHLGPQPELSDIPALADELTNTGADVTLELADLPDRFPAAVQLSAYRIVQESLTNVIRHAGPAPTVDITVAVDGHRLIIDITNTFEVTPTDSAPTPLPASGFGIAGMGERATLLGGSLTAGPELPDRYRVHAWLPLEPEQL